jgi:hypothetical protein
MNKNIFVLLLALVSNLIAGDNLATVNIHLSFTQTAKGYLESPHRSYGTLISAEKEIERALNTYFLNSGVFIKINVHFSSCSYDEYATINGKQITIDQMITSFIKAQNCNPTATTDCDPELIKVYEYANTCGIGYGADIIGLCVNGFFGGQESSYGLAITPSRSTNLIPGTLKSDVKQFIVPFADTKEKFCKLIAHEVGHCLGLAHDKEQLINDGQLRGNDQTNTQGISNDAHGYAIINTNGEREMHTIMAYPKGESDIEIGYFSSANITIDEIKSKENLLFNTPSTHIGTRTDDQGCNADAAGVLNKYRFDYENFVTSCISPATGGISNNTPGFKKAIATRPDCGENGLYGNVNCGQMDACIASKTLPFIYTYTDIHLNSPTPATGVFWKEGQTHLYYVGTAPSTGWYDIKLFYKLSQAAISVTGGYYPIRNHVNAGVDHYFLAQFMVNGCSVRSEYCTINNSTIDMSNPNDPFSNMCQMTKSVNCNMNDEIWVFVTAGPIKNDNVQAVVSVHGTEMALSTPSPTPPIVTTPGGGRYVSPCPAGCTDCVDSKQTLSFEIALQDLSVMKLGSFDAQLEWKANFEFGMQDMNWDDNKPDIAEMGDYKHNYSFLHWSQSGQVTATLTILKKPNQECSITQGSLVQTFDLFCPQYDPPPQPQSDLTDNCGKWYGFQGNASDIPQKAIPIYSRNLRYQAEVMGYNYVESRFARCKIDWGDGTSSPWYSKGDWINKSFSHVYPNFQVTYYPKPASPERPEARDQRPAKNRPMLHV